MKHPSRIKSVDIKDLFEKYYCAAVRTAVFYTNDYAAGEDIAQSVFEYLWNNKQRLTMIDDPQAYIMRAVRNRGVDYLNHLSVVHNYRREYLKTTDLTPEEIESSSVNLEKLLAQLPEKRRQVIELSILDSMTYQQISQKLDISPNTVKDHITKAYAFLREKISK